MTLCCYIYEACFGEKFCVLTLQMDVDNCYNWSINNKMHFNFDKCKVLRVTNKFISYMLPFYEFWYSLNGKLLDYEICEKDLGVYIHNKLSWKDHCESLKLTIN